jgi:3-deoxy-D-manno-octulosonic acid kinase
VTSPETPPFSVAYQSWPAGYRSAALGGTLAVARDDMFDAIVAALGMGTLHAWASTQPGAVAMQGREVAWATTLPGGARVVVRHARHGGVLAVLTRDLFLAPTRAPNELDISVRLRAGAVSTPEVIAYAVYSAAGPLCRADVMTDWLEGADLPAAWSSAEPARRPAIVDAVADLIVAMGATGARHHDLNAKNIIVGGAGEAPRAWVIDVDRVTFERAPAASVAMQNARRLGQSLAKLRASGALAFDDGSWARFLERAQVPATAAPLAR